MEPCSTRVQTSIAPNKRNTDRVLNERAEREKYDGECTPDSKKRDAYGLSGVCMQTPTGIHWRLTQMLYKQRCSSEEMRAHNCRQRVKVEECKKIDRAELAIHCRRPADPCADCQIRAQQS